MRYYMDMQPRDTQQLYVSQLAVGGRGAGWRLVGLAERSLAGIRRLNFGARTAGLDG